MRLGEWLREHVLGAGPSGDFAVSHHDYRSALRERVRDTLRDRAIQGTRSEADIERLTEKAIDMTESRDVSSLLPDIPGPPPQSWYDLPLDTVTGILTGVLVKVLEKAICSGTEQGQPNDETQVIQEALDSVLAERWAAMPGQHIVDALGGNDAGLWVHGEKLSMAARIAVTLTDQNVQTMVREDEQPVLVACWAEGRGPPNTCSR